MGWAGSQIYDYALTSKAFAIRTIEIEGLQRADRQTLLSLGGIREGDNVLAVDTDEAAARIKRHPWIDEVDVTRRPPQRLSVHVVEFEPAVLVALGNLYYANPEGEIVKRHAPGERESLPVVTGLTRQDVEKNDGWATRQLRMAIGFLDDLESVLKGDAPQVDELHIDAVMGLSFTPAGSKSRIRVGRPPFSKAIERWHRIEGELKRRGLVANRITLGGVRRPERAIARLVAQGEKPTRRARRAGSR